MDESTLRGLVEAHAQAVVDPMDAEHVQSDMIDELHPQLPSIAQLLPQPVTSATVKELVVHGDHADVKITYSGADAETTIHSRWEERDGGRPLIVEAAPV